MKKFHNNIVAVLIAFVLIACGENLGEGDVYYYSMENKSGRPMVIKSYRSDFPDVTPDMQVSAKCGGTTLVQDWQRKNLVLQGFMSLEKTVGSLL